MKKLAILKTLIVAEALRALRVTKFSRNMILQNIITKGKAVQIGNVVKATKRN